MIQILGHNLQPGACGIRPQPIRLQICGLLRGGDAEVEGRLHRCPWPMGLVRRLKIFTFSDEYSILASAWKNKGWLLLHGLPFFGHLSWSLPRMASIERTAYPRFKASLSAHELHTLYGPTDEERAFVAMHARGDAQQLTLLTLLKCQQHLGSLPPLTEVPEHIRVYLCQQLHLLPLMAAY